MSEKALGVHCHKCNNIIPLMVGHNIYCPNCKALMVVANLTDYIPTPNEGQKNDK